MPRHARIVIAGMPMHIVQRGHNRQACFLAIGDYMCYLQWLTSHANTYGCQIHAYVLMTNHVHLLLTPETKVSLALMMKKLNQQYVSYFNRRNGRSGSLWEGRFHSSIIEDEAYLLSCYRYIELNPVRAGIVAHPADYPWTSFHANAAGRRDQLITAHPIYVDLGQDAGQRSDAYRKLFATELAPELVADIRAAAGNSYILGTTRFADTLAGTVGRRVTPGTRGRPKQLGSTAKK